MKKIILLFVVIASAFGLHQAAAQTSTYHMPFNRIAQGNDQYTTIDYSKLNKEQVIHNQDGSYSVSLPFIVEKAIAADDIFWLALAFDRHGMQSWGLYDGDSNFLCKSLLSYQTNPFSYIVQSQDHLTKKIVPGKYHLIVNFSAKPAAEDLWIILGYSTRQYYDNYTATLEKEHMKAEAAKAPKYDKVWDYDSNGLAIVKKDDKYGLIDRAGKEILPVEYDDISTTEFNDSWFGIDYLNYYCVEKDGKEWLADKTGRQVTDSKYDKIYGFKNGYAIVEVEKGIEYFIDRTGKRIGAVYEEISGWRDDDDNYYYRVKRSGKWGVLNDRLGVVIPCEYSKLKIWDSTRIDGKYEERDAAYVKQGSRCYRIILENKAKTETQCGSESEIF